MNPTNQFWHNLTPGLAETLRKFGLRVKDLNRNKIHIRQDIDLDISANNNFQKLRYWGCVAKYKEEGRHIAGFWVITRLGAAFLRNEIDMPKKVLTQDNHKIGESQERVRIIDLIRGYDGPYWQETFVGIKIDQPSLL